MSSSTAIEPTTQNGNAVAKQPTTIKGWLNSDTLKNEIARALPKHCSAERMTRIAITAITRTPKLAECEPASFLKCMMDLSQWGLEPNGRDAHLIPFNNRRRGVVECQLILDYKGLVQLLYRSGQILSVHADVVYEGDDFAYSMGELLRHTQFDLRTQSKPAERGKMIAAYARIVLKGGACKCEVMTKEQIDGIRKRSKSGNDGPWVTDYEEMAKKTVFRRATKWLPLSAEIIQAFERDDDRPANLFGGGTIVDTDFVVPPTSLNQLADRRKEQAETEPGETIAHDGEIATDPESLTALKDKIALAMDPASIEAIRAANVGPESPHAADQWDIIDGWCNARLEELSKPAKGQKELIDKGSELPE